MRISASHRLESVIFWFPPLILNLSSFWNLKKSPLLIYCNPHSGTSPNPHSSVTVILFLEHHNILRTLILNVEPHQILIPDRILILRLQTAIVRSALILILQPRDIFSLRWFLDVPRS